MSYTINEYQNFECLPIRPSLVTMEKTLKWKPNKIELAPNCPRCASSNTKFCYYNNYSVSQPRYFCKSCRRYWTKGGSLRNVPVGGGCRKNRRHSRSTKQDGGATPTSTADGDGLIASSSSATRDVSMEFDGRLTRGNCDSGAVFEDQKEMDFLMNDHQVHDQCVDGQDLVYEGFSGVDEMEGIDLQGFDVLWPGVSQDATGGLDHHFEMFASASDDQMRISANHDNWGWLDCEIFTRP